MQLTPLQAFIDRVIGKYIGIVREEKLLPEPLSKSTVFDTINRFVHSGDVINQEDRTARVGWGCFARMAILEPDFSKFEGELRRFYPNIPSGVHSVERSVIEGALLARRTGEGQRMTMLLGAGRDVVTIREAHERGDHVVVVDNDTEVIQELKDHPLLASMAQSSRLVFERTNFADTSFMARYANKVDLIYFFYSNDYQQGLVTILNVMKGGAQLVTQQIYDDAGQFTGEANRIFRRTDEFRLAHQYSNVVPPYQTPWSRVYPTGNVVNIIERDPHPTVAGRLFFELVGHTGDTTTGGVVAISMKPLSLVLKEFGLS